MNLSKLLKNKHYLLTFFLFIANFSFSQTIIENTYVSGIWTKDNSPYYIQNDIEIPENSFLFIENGVKIEFQGFYSLTVKGNIFCMGSYNDSIIFTINDTTNFSNNEITDGGWAGINFSEAQYDTSFFNYCIFEYGKSTTLNNEKGGVIRIYSSNRYNKFENCSFRNNKAKKGGVVYYFIDMTKYLTKNIFTNCNFKNNIATVKGGVFFIIDYQQSLSINNCYFYNNKSIDGGGIYYNTGSLRKFNNNLFYKNYAVEHGGSIFIEGSSSLDMFNCIFDSNYAKFGAAISSYIGTNIKVINSTFINNYSENCTFYIGNIHTIQILNSIFWNEATSEILKSDNGSFDLSYSNIRNASDSLWFTETCIDVNPNIIIFENKNYILDKSSLCINSGIVDTSNLEIPLLDFYKNPRIYLDTIDMGATEFDSSFVINSLVKNNIKNNIIIFPNPVNDYLIIESKFLLIKNIKLYNISGVEVLKSNCNNYFIDLCVNEFSGIYLLNILFEDGSNYLKKIVIDN